MTNPSTILNHLKQASYISAALTLLMVLVEVPIVILYVVTRFVVIFTFTCFGMVTTHLVCMAWDKLSTKEKCDV